MKFGAKILVVFLSTCIFAFLSCAKDEKVIISYTTVDLRDTLSALSHTCAITRVVQSGSSYSVYFTNGRRIVLKSNEIPVFFLDDPDKSIDFEIDTEDYRIIKLIESFRYWSFIVSDGTYIDILKEETLHLLNNAFKEGSSMACFGGSVGNRATSSRDYWSEVLRLNVDNYSIGGAGYTKDNNILLQVEDACEAGKDPYDVYLFWCSTNDMNHSVEAQNDGILKCFDIIRNKSKESLIVLFTSLPKYDTYGYEHEATSTHTYLYQLVDGQISCCEAENVRYYDQFHNNPFNIDNYTAYYHDFTHPKKRGYDLISIRQALVIAGLE